MRQTYKQSHRLNQIDETRTEMSEARILQLRSSACRSPRQLPDYNAAEREVEEAAGAFVLKEE